MTEPRSEHDYSPGARVRTLASQMRERCLRLDELSGSIAQQAHDDEPDQLVTLLAEREPLVVELAGFVEELAAILDDPQSARELGRSEHDQIRERLGQLEKVMSRIRERDKQARSALQHRRDQLADQLSSVNIARGAARAYSGAGRPVNPTVQDSQG